MSGSTAFEREQQVMTQQLPAAAQSFPKKNASLSQSSEAKSSWKVAAFGRLWLH